MHADHIAAVHALEGLHHPCRQRPGLSAAPLFVWPTQSVAGCLSQPNVYMTSAQLLKPLKLMYESLISTGDDSLATAALLDVIRQARVNLRCSCACAQVCSAVTEAMGLPLLPVPVVAVAAAVAAASSAAAAAATPAIVLWSMRLLRTNIPLCTTNAPTPTPTTGADVWHEPDSAGHPAGERPPQRGHGPHHDCKI